MKRGLGNPRKVADWAVRHSARWFTNDKLYLSLLWRMNMGYRIDWDNPRTFCEKIQWLKLYNRRPEYTQMVDKHAVKEYVAKRIGEEYVIPTLGVWDSPEDIDWDSLPDRFVLKTTHGGGGIGIVICNDKQALDKEKAIRKLRKSLNSDIYTTYREWPYKDVPKRIIAEQFMEEKNADDSVATKDLTDYKFFCFGGEPKYCQVIRDRNTTETIDFYDMEWNHLPFYGLNPVARPGLTPVARPGHLDTMIEIARKLSKDIPFARIDLYVINDKEYFGEITFYPAGGFGTFTPDEWNRWLGDWIELPTGR